MDLQDEWKDSDNLCIFYDKPHTGISEYTDCRYGVIIVSHIANKYIWIFHGNMGKSYNSAHWIKWCIPIPVTVKYPYTSRWYEL